MIKNLSIGYMVADVAPRKAQSSGVCFTRVTSTVTSNLRALYTTKRETGLALP